MSKHAMITAMGSQKALSKIKVLNEMPGRHRPDRDTGLDDEWSREFKLYDDEETNATVDDVAKILENNSDVGSEKELLEFQEDMQATGLHAASSSSSASSRQRPPSTSLVKVEGQTPDEDLNTFHNIKNSSKTVLRSLSETILAAKKNHGIASDASKAKYLGPLKIDIEKLLPKLKLAFNNIEKVHLKLASSTDEVKGEEILALARKLDNVYNEFNEQND